MEKNTTTDIQRDFVKDPELITKLKAKRKPRIGFEITASQEESLKRFIPWGSLTTLYQAITDDLVEIFEKHGSAKIIAEIISRKIKFYDVSKTLYKPNISNDTN